MRLEDDIDFTTLNWVKQELDDTLRQARQALEAYVEESSDQSQLRFCASFLHQVQGTLRMVELYGAAMVVEEMERLVQSLLDDEIRRRDDAYSVLMRGMVQMPDYLERLQGGHKDIPIVLLPLLNDLRACRGEKLLSESVLFAPDLAAQLPDDAEGPARAFSDSEVRQQAARLRIRYQSGLLAWIKNEESEPAITGLIDTLDELRAISFNPEARRLWWIAAGLLDAARQRAVDIGSAVKLLFGKVDREIKRLGDGGEQAILSDPPRELTQNLLYYLAHGAATGERVDSIRSTYRLQDLLPTQGELEHAKGSLSGKNRALLDTVSVAIKEDLLRVKDTLDLYLRRDDAKPAELSGQAAILDRVADTLGMLGLGVPRRVVQEQRRVLDDLASGAKVAGEAALLDIAGALLYVEVSLDENIRTLGVNVADAEGAAPGQVGDATALPKAEVKRILDALLRESIANVQRAKADVVAYIDSGWEGERLHQLPVALEEVVGAMRMLDQTEAASLVRALGRFVEVELVGQRRVPTRAQVEHLADAFTSIEYFLEATGESRSGREQILDVTRESLAALGYWPPPSEEELRARDAVADGHGPAEPFPFDDSSAPIRDERDSHPGDRPTEVADEDPVPALAGADASGTGTWDAFEPISSVDATSDDALPAAGPALADPAEPEVSEGVEVTADVAEEWHAASSDLAQTFDESQAGASEVESLRDAGPFTDSAPVPADFSLRDDGTEWPVIGDSPVFRTEVMGQSEALTADSQYDPDDLGQIIEIAELPSAGFDESLRSLDADLQGDAAPAAATAAAHSDDDSFEWIEVEEEVEEEIALGDIPGDDLPGGFDASAGEDIDDDIREVFIEEVNEEISNIGRLLPGLSNHFDDVETLRNIRRSFHTLKGSGRLVGALALGEFSWHVENMLNRVLDHTIRMDTQVVGVLEHSRVALHQLRTELRGMGAATALPKLVMQAADRLVAGEPATIETTRRVLRTRSVRVQVAKPPMPESAFEQQVASVDAHMEQAELLAAGMDAAALEEIDQQPAEFGGERMPEIEPMLLEVLRSEAGGYLTSLEGWIEQARDSGNRLVPTTHLLRAVHTLHGALGMVEVPVVAEVVGMLEGYLKRLVGANIAPSADGLEAMADVSGVVGATLALLDRPGAAVPPAGDLNDRLADLRDALPVPASPLIPSWGDVDAEEAAAEHAADGDLTTPQFGHAGEELAAGTAREDPSPLEEFAGGEHAVFDDHGFDEVAFVAPGQGDEHASAASGLGVEPGFEGGESPSSETLAAELLGDVPDADWEVPQSEYIEPEVVEHAAEVFDPRLLEDLGSRGAQPQGFDGLEVEDESTPAPIDADGFEDLPVTAVFEEPVPGEWETAQFEEHPREPDTIESAGMPQATEGAERADEFESESAVEAAAESAAGSLEPATGAEDGSIAAPASAAERRRKRKSARISKRDRAAGLAPIDVTADDSAASQVADEVEQVTDEALHAEWDETEFAEPLPMAASPGDATDIGAFDAGQSSGVNEWSAAAELSGSTVDEVSDAPWRDGEPADPSDSVVEPERDFQTVVAAGTPSFHEGSDAEWQEEADPDRPLVLPDLDADLLEIFVEEGRQILDESDSVLTQLRQDANSPPAIAALQRHLHTIKGNARAVGLMGIGDVSHALETLFDSPRGRTAATIEMVQRGFDRLHRMINRVAAGRDLAYPSRLIAMLEASAAGVPLPAQHMPVAEYEVPVQVDVVDAVTAHDRLALEEDLAPWSEAEAEAMAAAGEEGAEQSEPTAAAALEYEFDGDAQASIHAPDGDAAHAEALELDERGGAIGDTAESADFEEMAAAAELDAMRETETAMELPEIEQEIAAAPDEEPTPAAPVTNVVRLDDYRLPAQVIATDEAAQRQSQELIRVRADLLDSLVNYAGEVSIYRSRLEQQLGAFRTNVVELEQTVERTREQLRKLDIETEAQIIARFQREAEEDQETFDPLELDRFSNLQQLSRALAESVSDLVSLHGTLDDLARQQETLLLQQSRVASELQQGLMRTRMVPFETQVPFLRRLVRQSADESGKRAQLYVDGAQGEMDRNLLERMKAPLEHMLRNALAHGIETPAERSVQGKAGEGNVRIEVAREASEVLIRVSDDGRGLDREAIRRKAIERGLMHADSQLSDRDLFGFITETGFSTADTVSKLAGRGVGMDVVANEIRELGGSLSIDTEVNQGSRFTIRLPFTLAVTQAIMVRLGEAIFAVPMSSVQGVARLPLADFEARLSGADARQLAYGGEEYAVHDLALLLGTEPNRVVDTAGQLPLLLVRSGDQRAAIRVDSVVGSREIVVKSTGSQIASVPGMFGATIMGDGSVVMILDLAPLVRRHIARRAERAVADELATMLPGGFEIAPEAVQAEPSKIQVKRQLLVMVIDDSITMRKVTSRILERNDMEVVTAKDGVDAVEKLQERVPDLAILDIEMPRMDGYELATYIRNDARLRHLPLMMITSRTGEKHRQRAFEIGVDRFLGKPYQEADLLRTVFELIGDSPDA